MISHYEPDESIHQHYRLPRREQSVSLAEQHEGFMKNTRFHQGQPLVLPEHLTSLDELLMSKIREHQDLEAPPDYPHPKITLGDHDQVFESLDTLFGRAFRERTHPYVAIPLRHLDSVLRSDRLKNQFESMSSSGYYGGVGSIRDQHEQDLFGYSGFEVDPTWHPRLGRQRPTYGFVHTHPEDDDDLLGQWSDSILSHYGEAFVQLHDTIRPHTTVTHGDSLDDRDFNVLPTPYNAVHPGIFLHKYNVGLSHLRDALMTHQKTGDDRAFARGAMSNAKYIEAQYHTPVRPSQHFRGVFVPYDKEQATQALLRDHGLGHIPVRGANIGGL